MLRIRDERDSAAWSQFVEIYAPLIYGFARKRGLQDADSADVAQDVLQGVSTAIKKFSYDPSLGSFRGWLFAVTRHKLQKKLSVSKRPGIGVGGTDAVESINNQADPTAELSATWEREYQQRLFDWAAAQIQRSVNESTWRAFALTAIEGKKAREVAKELEMTVAAVYLAKSRVTGRLKALIEQMEAT
ncbi:MAG: sigma-70 family RNA polymerase sigma factor [Planctomycetales bacterium]|nr:sigma-70 family RNA polymerase sigma factor [Planctomycetales bacterium]